MAEEKKRCEKDIWENVKDMLGEDLVKAGPRLSASVLSTPRDMLRAINRYKFAAKMAPKQCAVLELGCGEGLGIPFLSEFASHYTGVDTDETSIAIAQGNWKRDKITLRHESSLYQGFGSFDAVVGFDLIAGSRRDEITELFSAISQNLGEHGMCVLGYNAGKADGDAVVGQMKEMFHTVLVFSLSETSVLAGDIPGIDYKVLVACHRKGGA